MPPVQLIAITGGSGSGKTWLARYLQRALAPEADIVSLDDFYCDLGTLCPQERALVNFDHPEAIDWRLFIACLSSIKKGEPVHLPAYDFTTHTRSVQSRLWNPRRFVLLDGLWLLREPELRELYTLKIYVDCPEALRLERRLQRDQVERGRSRASIMLQYRCHVAPMHELYVAPQKTHADMVLGPEFSENDLHALLKRVTGAML